MEAPETHVSDFVDLICLARVVVPLFSYIFSSFSILCAEKHLLMH